MKYLFANWKDALSVDESVALAKELATLSVSPDVQLVLFPSAAAFVRVKEAVGGKMVLGAQDIDDPCGAEGAYVLIGHSDRRAAGDTDEIVASKMKRAVTAGVLPVLCVSKIEEVEAALVLRSSDSNRSEVGEIFVAYEPLYAIGTGNNAPESEVAETAAQIRATVSKISPTSALHILYGGSVNAENVASYTHLPGVEGVLVGGAGTTAESLQQILLCLLG
ncbi:MAG: triosephosphate isomerase [Candidatus Magasanikbacteria bacterium]|nr:triosephosphate isomerase [Candidatus Magasanikbacteria bacterium]